VGYNFTEGWDGVSRGTFEVLTLGTLAVILLLAVIGYYAGARVRAEQADIPLEPVPAAESV
jgi:glutamate:GABA antiporter